MSQTDRNDPCPCGSTKKFKHCCQRKEKIQTTKPHAQAGMVPVWLTVAMQNLQAERLQQAKLMYEQVLQVAPRHADALQWLGVIAHKQGHGERALALIQEAIAASPGNAMHHSTLGNVLQAAGQGDAAIASYRQALSIRPDFAEAHNNLGIALFAQGKLSEAVESYRKAVDALPRYAEAFNNMGNALKAQELTKEAVEAYQKALALRPDYAQALFNLGSTLRVNDPAQAIAMIHKAAAIRADFYEAWIALFTLYKDEGLTHEAQECLRRAMSIRPSNSLKVASALLLPTIMGTVEEVASSRSHLVSELDSLITQEVTLADPYKEMGGTNFFLAYQGLDDKPVQQKVAQFYEQACPSLLYVAPHCNMPGHRADNVRIGFLSRFISRHSVAASFSRIVESVAQHAGFEVSLISCRDPQSVAIQETYPQFAGEHLVLEDDLALAREQIAALELDILVYLDIGMDPLSYFLAFARLARAQCVLGGHPVTTGIGAMDYFLSSAMAEPENAENHYSEQLVRLPLGCFYFKPAQLPPVFKTRAELGLPTEGRVYLCPMVLHKLHPDFDEAMTRILQLDPAGYVVLVADKQHASWQKLLQMRLQKTVPQDVRDRIIFIPWVSNPQDFVSLNKAADVVIDPFHFGMGTTAIATCSVGTPFVTKPGEFMRGRVALFYAKTLDVMECVAVDTEDYAAKAVAIATDPVLRKSIQAKILANNSVLFENPKPIADLVEFFSETAAKLNR